MVDLRSEGESEGIAAKSAAVRKVDMQIVFSVSFWFSGLGLGLWTSLSRVAGGIGGLGEGASAEVGCAGCESEVWVSSLPWRGRNVDVRVSSRRLALSERDDIVASCW